MGDSVKIVHGYVVGSWFKPVYEEDSAFVFDMSKSKAGKTFSEKHGVSENRRFSGHCYAVLGVSGRVKLIRFGRDTVYNFVVKSAGNSRDTVSNMLKNKYDIAKNCSGLKPEAIIFTLMYAANTVHGDEIRYELLTSDYNVANSIVDTMNGMGFTASVVNAAWQKVDGPKMISKDSGAVEVEAKEERNPDFFVLESDVNLAFTAAVSVMNQRGYASVLLTGPSGFGKTTAAIRLANHLGFSFTKVDCGTLQDPTEIATIRGFKDGQTVFERTEFINAFEAGNAVILLDEANRMYPNVSNSLMPVLDGTGQLTIDTEKFVRGKNIIFVATANIGQQYVGTFAIDTAFLNRFGISARVGQLSLESEVDIVYHHSELSREEAGHIVSLLRELRKTLPTSNLDFSPRTAENIALALKSGIGVHMSFRVVLAALCEDKEWKSIIDTLNSSGNRAGKFEKLLF